MARQQIYYEALLHRIPIAIGILWKFYSSFTIAQMKVAYKIPMQDNYFSYAAQYSFMYKKFTATSFRAVNRMYKCRLKCNPVKPANEITFDDSNAV